MFSKKLMTAALAIAAAGVFAGSAQASVIDYDDVRLTSIGYDFGDSGLRVRRADRLRRDPLPSRERWSDPTAPARHDPSQRRRRHVRPNAAWSTTTTPARGCRHQLRRRGLRDRRPAPLVVGRPRPVLEPAIDSVRVSVQKETVSGWATTTSLDLHGGHARRHGADHRGRRRLRRRRPGARRAAGQAPAACRGASTNGDVTPRPHAARSTSTTPSGACARMNLRYLTESGVVPHLAGRRHGVRARQRPPLRGASTSMPYASNKIGQVTVQLQTLGLERHLRHGRLADRLDQRVTASAGLGVLQGVPNPARGRSTDGRRLDKLDDSRLAARVARGRRGGLRRALRPPSQAAAVVLPAHAGQRPGRRGRAPADVHPGAPRAGGGSGAGRGPAVAVRDRPQPVQDDAGGAAGRDRAGRGRRAVVRRDVGRRGAARRPARAGRGLARLPEDQRGALVLFELGGLSQAEIATAIGVPAGQGQGARLPGADRADGGARRPPRLVRVDPRGARGRARRRAAARTAEAPPAPVRAVRRLPRGDRRAAHGPRVDPAGRPGARFEGRDPRRRRHERPRRGRRGAGGRRARRRRRHTAPTLAGQVRRRPPPHGARPAAARPERRSGERRGHGRRGARAAQRHGGAAAAAAQRQRRRGQRRRSSGGAAAGGAAAGGAAAGGAAAGGAVASARRRGGRRDRCDWRGGRRRQRAHGAGGQGRGGGGARRRHDRGRRGRGRSRRGARRRERRGDRDRDRRRPSPQLSPRRPSRRSARRRRLQPPRRRHAAPTVAPNPAGKPRQGQGPAAQAAPAPAARAAPARRAAAA